MFMRLGFRLLTALNGRDDYQHLYKEERPEKLAAAEGLEFEPRNHAGLTLFSYTDREAQGN